MDFSFSYDEQRILLMITQSHYWSLDTFLRYKQEFLAVHEKIRTRRRHYRVFADCTDYPVQSNEVVEAFAGFFNTLMNENKGHYAIIAGSTLNKMQVQRVIPQSNVKVFTDRDAAMAWLFEPGSLPNM